MSPPNTFSYMIGGYVAFILILAAYVFSLFVRYSRLKRETGFLSQFRQEELQSDENSL